MLRRQLVAYPAAALFALAGSAFGYRSLRPVVVAVGITAQREIERALECRRADGTVEGHETLPVRAMPVLHGLVDGMHGDREITHA